MAYYNSWVPNISNKLFFHLIDPYSYRIDRIIGDVINFSNNENLFISMLVDLRDISTKDANKFTRIIFNAQIKENKLSGSIYFFDDLMFKGLEKSLVEKKILLNH